MWKIWELQSHLCESTKCLLLKSGCQKRLKCKLCIFFIKLGADFTKKKFIADSVPRKNYPSISPTFCTTKFAKDVSSNLSNLCAICKPLNFVSAKVWRKNRAKMLMKSTLGVHRFNLQKLSYFLCAANFDLMLNLPPAKKYVENR